MPQFLTEPAFLSLNSSDLESARELSVQKASPVPLTEELWLNSFNTLL